MMRKLLYSFLFPIFRSLPIRLSTPSLGLLCIGMFFVVSSANADTFFSRRSGNWNARATWSYESGGSQVPAGIIPGAGDIVIIERGYTVTVNTNSACATLQVGSPGLDGGNNYGEIDFNGAYTLTVSGNSTFGGNGQTARTGTITFSNGSVFNTGSLNVGNPNGGTRAAGIIDMTSGGTMNISGGIVVTTVSGNSWTPGAGTVILSASNTLPSTLFTSFNNLTISSGTSTLGTGLTINGNLSITGGGLSAGNNNLTIRGSFMNAGTFNPGTATVTLNAPGAQVFNVSNFYNLTLAGTGTKNFTVATTIANALVINTNASANLGTQNHTAASLTYGGTAATPSSWGGTASPAANKNSTFFGTSATGILNVTCASFTSVNPITEVMLNTLDKTSSNLTTSPAYENFTGDTPTTLVKGQYYALTVKGNTSGYSNGYYMAYFDWNNNGVFTDSGENYIIGTINNSTGADGAITSIYLQIPATATAGNIKMRIVGRMDGYAGAPCVASGSVGQIEEYTVTLLNSCSGNPTSSTTVSSASSVCPNAPFVLSLGSTFVDGSTYVWEKSADGTNWANATPTSTNYFSSNFSTAQATNTTVGDITLSGGDCVINGTELILTDTALSGHNSGFFINKPTNSNINAFTAAFKYRIWGTTTGGTGADGMSFSYGNNVTAGAGGGENGEGNGIIIQFDTYDNEGVTTGGRVRVLYNNVRYFTSAINAVALRNASYKDVVLRVDANAKLSLIIAGVTVVSDLFLPGYATADKTSWKFKFSARTGGENDKHSIDDLSIDFLDTTGSNSTFTTSQTVKTYYRAKISCGGNIIVTSSSIMVDMISATINAKTVSACSGTAFNVTLVNGTDGTIPNGTTYTWTTPSVTGGLTGGAASTGTPSTITGTLTNTTATAQTATYTVTPVTGSCTGVPFTLTVTVNPSPTLTGVTQLASVCSGSAATINLTGLLASSTSTITYTIDGTPQAPITSVVATAGGTASFTTPVLTSANNGKTLQITGITVTSATPNCSSTSTRSVTLVVNPAPTLTGASQSTSVCSGSAATINLTGLLAGSTSTITYTIDGVAQTPITSLIATAGGTASFTTPALTSANNGKTLRITGVTTTSATPNCSSSFTTNVTLAVNPTPTLTGATQSAPVCTGSAATINLTGLLANSTSTISYTINNVAQTSATSVVASGTGAASFTTRALTSVDNLQTLQITQITTTSSTPNCSQSFTTNVTLSVNPLPAPTVLKDKDFTCESGGTVIISNLPANWTINQTGQAPQTITGTTSSRTITGLAAGNYNFTVTNNASTCTSNVAAITINNQTSSTTWNGSAWSNGLPDGSKSIIIAVATSVPATQPFTTATPDIYGCSLTVNSGAVVTIPSNVTLHITNIVATNGQLIFENNSSLLQTTNAVNTGNIVYKRATSIRRFDLTYWSSPVTKAGGITMHDFSPTTLGDKYFYFNPSSTWVTNMNGTMAMETGNGYSIRGPQEFDTVTPSVFTGTFTGVPNNGDITITGIPNNGVVTMPIIIDKYFLFGNPYPSAIDAEKLLNANKDVLGPLYFWTHVTPPQKPAGDNTYRYSSSDFTVFTLAGSTDITGMNTKPFAGKIAAGQGFMAKPKSTQINFNNAMRVGGTNNGEFFKTAKTTSLEKNRLWLNIRNAEGAFKQILVGYIEGATNNVDYNYDAASVAGNTYIDFYSINETKKLTIQARALPFENTDTVPLGYKTTVEGDFTIGIDHADGFFDKQEVYLEDKTTGKIVNLRNENYTFKTLAGTFADRFALRYTSKTLGTGDFEDLESSVLVSVKNKIVSITSSKETIKEVNIFNVGAQLLYSKNKVNAQELQINNLHSSDQVLLVKITLENGSTLTKKVIFTNL